MKQEPWSSWEAIWSMKVFLNKRQKCSLPKESRRLKQVERSVVSHLATPSALEISDIFMNVFGMAGMELSLPTAPLSKLCSVFVARMMLIAHQCYAFDKSQIKIMIDLLQIISIFPSYLLSVFLLNWTMHWQCPTHQADQESVHSVHPLLTGLAMSSPLSLGTWASAQFPCCSKILHLNFLCFKQGVFEINDWIFFKPGRVCIMIM